MDGNNQEVKQEEVVAEAAPAQPTPQPVAQSPEDVAATLFKLYQPKFVQLVDRLPLKQARRVLKRLVTYPLADKQYAPKSEAEKNAWAIGDRLLEAKYVMTIFAMSEQMNKKVSAEAQEEAKIVKVEDVLKENKGEENGTEEKE